VWLVERRLAGRWLEENRERPLALSYLLLPLIHHLLATPPGYRYISTASNFFAFNLFVQAFAVAVAAGLAAGATGGRRWLERRGRPQPAREGDTDGAGAG
jgi:hypothetical protein